MPEHRLEPAHVARGDVRAQLAAACACAVYWYNPLVWLAARAFARTCEQACDDRVLAAGRRPSDYAEDLLTLARALRGSPQQTYAGGASRAVGALPLLAPGDLPSRIREVLTEGRPRGGVTTPRRRAATRLAVAVVGPLAAFTAAAEPPSMPSSMPPSTRASTPTPPRALASVPAPPARASVSAAVPREGPNHTAAPLVAPLVAPPLGETRSSRPPFASTTARKAQGRQRSARAGPVCARRMRAPTRCASRRPSSRRSPLVAG